MAAMNSADRAACHAELLRDLSSETLGAVTKADVRAAVDAIDQFLHDNASGINTAIPQPARAQLTTSQKARLLMAVVRRRYLVGA